MKQLLYAILGLSVLALCSGCVAATVAGAGAGVGVYSYIQENCKPPTRFPLRKPGRKHWRRWMNSS